MKWKMPIQSHPLRSTDPEEYDGQELAYCISDARFYEPERELTDEEMLQLIRERS